MNNDELKKKIADIIYHTGCTGACCECDYSKYSDADTYCKAMLKASALIAAGIGDVKENENRARAAEFAAKTVTDKAILKYEEMKHRAEVAERALDKACECIANTFNPYWKRDFFKQNYVKEYKTQAEKELSEEGKDD